MNPDCLIEELGGLKIKDDVKKPITDFYIECPAVLYADYERDSFIIVIKDEEYYEEIDYEYNWRLVANIKFKLYYRFNKLYQTEMFFLEEPLIFSWPNQFSEITKIFNIHCPGCINHYGFIEMPYYDHILGEYNYGKIVFFEDLHDYSESSSVILIHK
jgi:hypothetical protein